MLILWLSKVLIFIDSFTMQTLSIHCILKFFDLFGFLRLYLLRRIVLVMYQIYILLTFWHLYTEGVVHI